MEEGAGVRSGEHAGVVVKNRSSSGCLIVRKKVDGVGGVGSSGSGNVYQSKKEKKRPRMDFSDSGSSEEVLVTPPQRRIDKDTIRVCNGLDDFDNGIVQDREIGRKRNRLDLVRQTEDGMTDWSGGDGIEVRRSKLDVFEFDEYDGIDGEKMRRKHYDDSGIQVGGRGFVGSMPVSRSGSDREYGAGSSRHLVVDKRKNPYFDSNRGHHANINRFEVRSDRDKVPVSLLREKYKGHSDEPIRLQGKNGVLKVMLNKNKKVGGSLKNYDHWEAEESRQDANAQDISKRTKKAAGSRKNGLLDEGNKKSSLSEDIVKRNVTRPLFHSETKPSKKSGSYATIEKNQLNLQKTLSAKKSRAFDWDSEGSDAILKLGSKNVEAENSMERVSCEGEKTASSERFMRPQVKEGKVKRGSGTAKQKLRERIREMLVTAGWKIDYRPRRNRDYLDAVYINPSGTAYWSIIKAYDALQKQLDDEDKEAKFSGDGTPLNLISDDVLSQLTRNTRKKMEKEMKKQRDRGIAKRSSKTKHDLQSTDSDSPEEKLSSFIKHGSKSLKGRANDNGFVSVNTRSPDSAHHLYDTVEKSSSEVHHSVQGRKSRKLGRCTLLVRSSSKALNSETDGYIPYTGKRTLLSWLVDSGSVQLSQKVQYMNRRQTRIMLEGWITRDGIHCGCCSKILTVSKFEVHAGSKLRQPFQNIYLESGVSLLQCQIDAWNRQEESERIGFHSIDTDGDDPNDDTCSICADGGDLICCDGCPSTFHQSCLDINTLPPGDWHCPNCTCKFCGVAHQSFVQGDNTSDCALLTCSLCEKKFHESCANEMDSLPSESNSSMPSFCGQKCGELFEHIQKYLGVKHELENGYSWCLVRRMDAELDAALRGIPQKVECNSKLAVALAVVNECFLPIIDRRSGINLIHNVLYNCGSNFNRLNYNGFYTAILERGDEIISAASIRFHGTQLAEMPFIGTRPIYRRQGMCRRLFCAIESALRSLKVEKLIIPAIADLMHTWTVVFGFKPLKESLKQELRSMNMLVFPGIDMLQKMLLEQDNIEEMSVTEGAKKMELQHKHSVLPEVANKADMDSSVGHDSNELDDAGLLPTDEIKDEVVALDPDSQLPVVSLNNTSLTSSSLDASHEPEIPVHEGTTFDDSLLGEKLVESASAVCDPMECDGPCLHTVSEIKDEVPEADCDSHCLEVRLNDTSRMSISADAHQELKIPISTQGTARSDSPSVDKKAESNISIKCLLLTDVSHDAIEVENKPEVYSPVGNIQSSEEGDMDAGHELDANVPSC